MAEQPHLSVIVVTPLDFAYIRRVVTHLARQTIAGRIELVPVAPGPSHLADADASDLAPFAEVNPFYTGGAIEDMDDAAGLALMQGKADVIAYVEDHAFPEPGWAQALLQAHTSAWAVVGSAVLNANPGSGLSWANQLIAYGHYSEPIVGGPRPIVSRHNASFKRAVLQRYGDKLPGLLRRGGALMETLKADGHTLYLAADARIHHLNPSNLGSTTELRFFAGRLSAGSAAARQRWSPPRRLAAAALSLLQPARRFKRVAYKVFSPVHRRRLHRLLPAMVYTLGLDCLGQVLGCLAGPGGAGKRLARFEYDRLRHLNKPDRLVFGAPIPDADHATPLERLP